MNDERLKNPKPFGADYFDELLERIKDIRSSEARFYEKVKAIYATSADYSKKDKDAQLFFKTVQNKMHYSVHGNTAAERCFRMQVQYQLKWQKRKQKMNM